MNEDDKAVPAKMDLMSKVFLGRLHVRYEKMNAVLALCRTDPANDANWGELHRLFHALADAAGTFGHDSLAEQAGMIELLLADMLKQKARTQTDADEVARLLGIMQSSA
jgi:HPt (histidine-containing phosphotransfer) domain-containing protein